MPGLNVTAGKLICGFIKRMSLLFGY